MVMTILIVGKYFGKNSNNYIQLLADSYMEMGHTVLYDVENFLFSNFIPDVVHIQWPEAFYRWQRLILSNDEGLGFLRNRLQWYRKNGVKFVYTVHNLLPHDTKDPFDYEVYSLLLENMDVIVHHGSSSIEIIKQKYPNTKNKKHIVAPHGHYNIEALPDKKDARKRLGLPQEKFVCTNFGLQRKYKGREFLYDLFLSCKKTDICFLTAGRLVGETEPFSNIPKERCHKEIYKQISFDEMLDIVSATDIFVLTHQSGLNSGLIALALTYAKPVLFPDIGNFKDQVKGWQWYETYEVGKLDLALNALERLYTRLKDKNTLDNAEWLKQNSWHIHTKNIIDALKII